MIMKTFCRKVQETPFLTLNPLYSELFLRKTHHKVHTLHKVDRVLAWTISKSSRKYRKDIDHRKGEEVELERGVEKWRRAMLFKRVGNPNFKDFKKGRACKKIWSAGNQKGGVKNRGEDPDPSPNCKLQTLYYKRRFCKSICKSSMAMIQ